MKTAIYARKGDTIDTEERCAHCGAPLDAECTGHDERGPTWELHCTATRECESCGAELHREELVEIDGCYECRECHGAHEAECAAESMDGDHASALASVYGSDE